MSEKTKVYTEKMDSAILHFENELGGLRAGRANPGVLNKVMVDYYGTPTPINQIAAVSVAESRILTITPWDSSLMHIIEKAVLTSDIGINPTNDGHVMRLVFPAPNEERRKALCKEVQKLAEEAKIAIRNVRREALDCFKAQKKDSDITEDDLKNLENEMQKITDKFGKNIDELSAKKQKEVMEI
ncbi:MAG: ribosome recycling factor [Oscillospiraceae bacterium]